MPLLKIDTNVSIDTEAKQALLANTSKLVAEILGKPESYVMVKLETNPDMMFAGTNAPLVYAELKSIGLPEAKTKDFSASLAMLFADKMQVDSQRVYIEFANAERHMWGWNGSTF